MEKRKPVMIGIKVGVEVLQAVEKARAVRGMRSCAAFVRWCIHNELLHMGIHIGPAKLDDHPTFYTGMEISSVNEPAPVQAPEEFPVAADDDDDAVDLSQRPPVRKDVQKPKRTRKRKGG